MRRKIFRRSTGENTGGEPFLHEIFVGKDGAVTLDGHAVEEQNGVPRELVMR
jgi:hypothetical protein